MASWTGSRAQIAATAHRRQKSPRSDRSTPLRRNVRTHFAATPRRAPCAPHPRSFRACPSPCVLTARRRRGSAFGKRPAAAQEEAAAAFEKWNQKRAPTGDYSHEKWPQKRARTGDHTQDVQARAPSGRARQATNSFRFSAVERRADTTKKAPSRPSTPLSVAETRNSTPFTAPPLLDGAKAPEVQDKLVLPFAELMQHLRSDGASGIVGREEEQRTISTFLDGTVRCKPARSGALYVSGRPGCGKTLSVRTLTGKCNRVAKVAWINGMTLVNGGRNLFSDILEVVDREVWSRLDDSKNDTARQLLPKLFCRKSSRPTILVLDELDALIQSGPYQSTLSSLFAWTRLSGSKLVLIGIANTCDLTHRSLELRSCAVAYKSTQAHT